jgi:hypothetical protein
MVVVGTGFVMVRATGTLAKVELLKFAGTVGE